MTAWVPSPGSAGMGSADMRQGGEHMFASLSRLGRNGEYLLFWGVSGRGLFSGKSYPHPLLK